MSKATNLDSIENDKSEPSKTGKFATATYNIGGFIVGFLALFSQSNRCWLIILLMYPLIGIVMAIFGKGFVKFISNDKSRLYGNISLGFIITSIFLVLQSSDDYTLYQNDDIWVPAIFVGVVILVGIYFAGANPSIAKIKIDLIFMMLIGLLYSYGSTREINCAFDYSQAKIYKSTVLGQREHRGRRHDSYYLTLTPWGPIQHVKEEAIDGYLYDRVKIGDTVKVNFRRGLLNIPWYVVTKN